jgi:hypothetical protein
VGDQIEPVLHAPIPHLAPSPISPQLLPDFSTWSIYHTVSLESIPLDSVQFEEHLRRLSSVWIKVGFLLTIAFRIALQGFQILKQICHCFGAGLELWHGGRFAADDLLNQPDS